MKKRKAVAVDEGIVPKASSIACRRKWGNNIRR
jgi:hypothetical protein